MTILARLSAGLALAFFCLACCVPVGPAGKAPVPYKVLNDTTSGSAPVKSLEVLVDEKTTKAQALQLADFLIEQHKGKTITLNIFDSHEAWQGSRIQGYPEKELDRHWLVSWDNLTKDGKPRWVATARDH